MPPEAWAHVFEPLRGKRVGYCPTPGNAGDRLIEAGTLQLLHHFGVAWAAGPDPGADVLLCAGGGSMGAAHYDLCRAARLRALAAGPPVWVLPQSWWGPDPEAGRFARTFARDPASLAHAPGAELAPDLALALDYTHGRPAEEPFGLFLRRDAAEARWPGRESRGDPVTMARDGWHYLELAGRFAHVATDRLHFAVAALLCGRRATLLPNLYHKCRAAWEAWLAPLGCGWAENPDEVTP